MGCQGGFHDIGFSRARTRNFRINLGYGWGLGYRLHRYSRGHLNPHIALGCSCGTCGLVTVRPGCTVSILLDGATRREEVDRWIEIGTRLHVAFPSSREITQRGFSGSNASRVSSTRRGWRGMWGRRGRDKSSADKWDENWGYIPVQPTRSTQAELLNESS